MRHLRLDQRVQLSMRRPGGAANGARPLRLSRAILARRAVTAAARPAWTPAPFPRRPCRAGGRGCAASSDCKRHPCR